MNRLFDHEKPEVYQESLVPRAGVAWLQPLLQKLPKSVAVPDQLDRVGTSIVVNLADASPGVAPFGPPGRDTVSWRPRSAASQPWRPGPCRRDGKT